MKEFLGEFTNKIVLEGKRKLNDFISSYDITGKQARILHFIYNASKHKEVNQTDVEEHFLIRGPSVTSILQTLEKKGFIKRLVSKFDARKKVLVVTHKGECVYAVIDKKISEFEKAMVKGIDDKDLSVLEKCFNQILKNLVEYSCGNENN